MLVRTGALNIHLVDGENVERVNLNRPPFTWKDVGSRKTIALEKHLLSINKNLKVKSYDQPFFTSSQIKGSITKEVIEKRKELRKNIHPKTSVVIVAMDKFAPRQDCCRMCQEKGVDWLSIGIEISPTHSEYVCLFNYKYFNLYKDPNRDHYGVDNGSYCSIIAEASSVGLNLLLYNLSNPDSPIPKRHRRYDNFIKIAAT